ncbi:hypothetical protein Tsubulata_003665 [Turnera subulata]|uniref:DNA-directed RNA polymerase III subunit RPC4 n=1 Tax=Turnera subulata TaxID=218843 RepID=A0A9Q0FWD3_9ROSI|nr:hypothetical protein Tsubulata_003665 [Turnera subulata]
MDQEQDRPSTGGRRKFKFTPRAQPRSGRSTSATPPLPKREVTDNQDEAAQAEKLMTKFTANLRRNVPKTEKKSSVQVAFGPGASSSTCLRKYGEQHTSNSSCLEVKDSIDYDVGEDGMMVISSSSTVGKDGLVKHPPDTSDELAPISKKGYKEPWDCSHNGYPISLPLRRPYSGDPELLDEAEFGPTTKNLEYDETTVNPAMNLGLLEECDDEKMFFFQLPPKLPIVRRSAGTKGKEKTESSMLSGHTTDWNEKGSLEELPEGYMGKMLIYKSGAVKLKLGNTLYDVSPGSDCIFAQDVMAINTAAKHCCGIGELGKRAVVTPDLDSLLNSVIDLG